nr:gustatory receptor 44.2 [Papilio polytes]
MIKIRTPKFNLRNNALLRNYNSDFLLDNFLEPEFRKKILPLYILQCLTLAPKYFIYYNLLTSNSRRTNMFIVANAIIISLKYSYDIAMFMNIIKVNLNAIYLSLVCLQLGSFFAVFIVNSLLTVLRSETNARLIIQLQRIYCSCKIKMEVKHTMIINWILLFSIILYHIVIFIIRMTIFNDSLSFTILTHVFVLSIDCSNIYMARVLTLFKNAILSWISEYQTLTTSITEADDIRSSISKLESTYDELIEVLKMLQSVFGLPIACFVVTTFTQAMSNVQTLLEEPTWDFNFILALTWHMRNILLTIMISLECEKIYTSLKNLQVTYVMSRMAVESTKGAFGGVLPDYGVLTAGAMLAVDAALPACLLATIAAYAVVLLQIKFLS